MKAHLILSVCKGRPCGRGVTTYYFQVRKGFGAKFFRTEFERDEAYDAQERWAGLDLAPKVGRKINRSYRYQYRYGYVTQSAPPNKKAFGRRTWGEQVHVCDNYVICYRHCPDSVRYLCERASDLGYRIRDVHKGNIGFRQGFAYFIDFDCEHANAT